MTSKLAEYEARYGYYRRATGLSIWVLIIALAIVASSMASRQPIASSECRTFYDKTYFKVTAMEVELASAPEEIRDLLVAPVRPSTAKHWLQNMCIEGRIATYAKVLGQDSTVFIPLYVMLGFAALGWFYYIELRAHPTENPARSSHIFYRLLASSAFFVVVTMLLDARENSAALKVLNIASGQNALGSPALLLTEPLNTMRHMSLLKWLFSGLWAGSLAALAWHQHCLFGATAVWYSKVLTWALVGLGAIAALLLIIGSVWGLADPVPRAACLISAGFTLVFAYAFVLGLLTCVHR